MSEMGRLREMVSVMLHEVDRDWMLGTVTPLFTPIVNPNVPLGKRVWVFGKNALAYGLERGMELGYKMKEAELK